MNIEGMASSEACAPDFQSLEGDMERAPSVISTEWLQGMSDHKLTGAVCARQNEF
jgi:hypothetical protein